MLDVWLIENVAKATLGNDSYPTYRRRNNSFTFEKSSEASWRILGFAMCDKSHAVEMLSVHLENMHMVYFRPTDDI